MNNKKVILNQVMSIDRNGFCLPACIASIVLSQTKSKSNATINLERKQKEHFKLYKLLLAASGIGFAHVTDYKHLTNGYEFTNLMMNTASDRSIEYAMRYIGYKYKIILSADSSKEEMWNLIKSSIDQGIPVLAEKIVSPTWELVTGYDETDESLIGWHVSNSIPQKDSDQYKVDGYEENNMFIKRNWADTISRFVIIADTKKNKKFDQGFIDYWIQVMDKHSEFDNLAFGVHSYEPIIKMLSDDSYFDKLENDKLEEIYRFLHNFGPLAEARAFTNDAINLLAFAEKTRNGNSEEICMKKISRLFSNTHNYVWKLWSVMGENHICEPEKYAKRLQDKDIRKQMIDILDIFMKDDMEALVLLKEIQSRRATGTANEDINLLVPNGARLIQETVLKGVVFEIIEIPETIFAGKLAYSDQYDKEPDIDLLYKKAYVYNDINKDVIAPLNHGCSVGISIDYWKDTNYNEINEKVYRRYMFAIETSSEKQLEGIDIYKNPPSLYVRVRCDGKSSRLLGKDSCASYELFGYLASVWMPKFGYKHATHGAQEFEYRCLNGDYTYSPIVKA